MPLYDYRCARCGDFRALRPMSESGSAVACPACGAQCARALSVPFLAGHGTGRGGAHASANPERTNWRHACGFGCRHAGCGA